MKKILFIILLSLFVFDSFCQAPTDNYNLPIGAPSTGNVINGLKSKNFIGADSGLINIYLQSTDQLASKRGKVGMSVVVNQTGRGGKFDYHSTSENLVPDSGIVFYAANGFFVRDTSQVRAWNIQWFGAVAGGLATYKIDSAAIRYAVRLLWRNNGGALYFPGMLNFYGWNGNGIPTPSNTEIFGDGASSKILHVDPESANYYKGVIFYTTTYATDSVHNPYMKAPRYSIEDAIKGQTYVVLKSIADTIHFPVGKVVLMGAKVFFKGPRNKSKKRCIQNDINSIAKIHNDSLFFEYALSDSLYADTADAKIYDVNSGTTSSPQLGTDYMSKNVYIHDLTLAQADYNMLDGSPYDSQVNPFTVLGLGGTFDTKFQNLTLINFGAFGGNLFGHCEISNIKIIGARKACDFGFSTSSTSFHDISIVYYRNIFIDSVEVADFYIDDGNHEFNMYNITQTGNWTGNNILKIANAAHHIYVNNIKLDLPQYISYSESGIDIDDDDAISYCHDIYINNFNLNVDTIGKYIEISGNTNATDDKNIIITNSNFIGATQPDSTSGAVTIKNSGNIYMSNCFFSNGDTVSIKNCNGGRFEAMRARNCTLSADDASQVFGDFKDGMNGISVGRKSNFRNQSVATFGVSSAPDFVGSISTSIGNSAMLNITGGTKNVALGSFAMKGLSSGQSIDSSIAIGASALQNVITGSAGNVALGQGAGTGIRDGKYNTIIGTGADAKTITTSNAIALGYNAKADDNEFGLPDATSKIKIRGVSYTFPSADGTVGQVLSTNGSKVLAWATVTGVGSVSGTTDRITVTGSSSAVVNIASTYAGQTSLTTLGTITTGTWNGTTIALANGGTGSATASGARTNLGATTIGANLFTLTNPSAITFPRYNADNTVSTLDASTFRTAIGAGTGSGDALTSGTLAQFAATTSAQLRGVISDELGTGADLFDGATPTSFTLTNATGLPESGVTNLVSDLALKAPLASATFTGTVVIPTPFTIGATSVTATGTQLNYLNAATGTTGTASTNVVYSTSPTITTPILSGNTTVTGSLSVNTSSFNATIRTTNGGSNITAIGLMDIGGTAVTAGSLGVAWDNTTGFQTFTAANGTRRIVRGYIGINNLTNTANSEAGDVVIGTQTGGAAATTKLTVTAAGNLTVANGNLTFSTAGNKIFITEGSNASVGSATLSSGTVTVTTSACTSSSRVFVTLTATGGTLGNNYKVVAGSGSFVITSVAAAGTTQTLDTSTLNWWVIN